MKDVRFLVKKKEEFINILFYKKKFKVDIFIVIMVIDFGNCKLIRIDILKWDCF